MQQRLCHARRSLKPSFEAPLRAHLFRTGPTQTVRLVRGLSVSLSAVTSQLTTPLHRRKMSF
jgi:hypothetical protein